MSKSLPQLASVDGGWRRLLMGEGEIEMERLKIKSLRKKPNQMIKKLKLKVTMIKIELKV